MKIEVLEYEKSGSIHYTRVSNTAPFKGSFQITGDWVRCQNKHEYHEFHLMLDDFNSKLSSPKAKVIPISSAKPKKKCRYIELLVLAQRGNLNYGQPWCCTASNVDEKQLPPHFEGEQVCYVYP